MEGKPLKNKYWGQKIETTPKEQDCENQSRMTVGKLTT